MPRKDIEARNEYSRTRYATLRQQGLCVHGGCGKPSLKSRCPEHLLYFKKVHRKRRKDEKRSVAEIERDYFKARVVELEEALATLRKQSD